MAVFKNTYSSRVQLRKEKGIIKYIQWKCVLSMQRVLGSISSTKKKRKEELKYYPDLLIFQTVLY
jgi:hypothetical protein